ncbi:SDR family NAD(P)-dependent oxidoreductase [Xenorhabdus hominickii]|uniref:3-amino-tetrahydro-pyrrolizinone reductase n=2 Tax=Xenorhabdus hominickii TaxID=351679 RepID=XHPD_XENHO|nr:SDR family NAD(P)-dependent oxidoreductase [Xenorhabdus hominickii]AOM41429.1 retinol dehydrogenase [Xenorhabdus hominickii]PHM57347.1 3-oxoacyl-ACP reductase [Xenorhabdus hominickii]
MTRKSILVTGASSGLGYAAVQKLAENGFYVFAAVREIRGMFSNIKNIKELKLDLANEQSIEELFIYIEATQKDYPLWGLVNNAGICVPSPLELLREFDLRQQLDTNVIGQLLVTQFALPFIRKSKGRIINITSGLGSIAVPYLGAYSIAQFAKMAFTDVLRRELKHSGVTVSVVQPGAIYTPIWDKFLVTGQEILDNSLDEKRKIYERSFIEFLKASQIGVNSVKTTRNDFAKVILDIFKAEIPETHYYVGDDAKNFSNKSKILTVTEIDEWFDLQSPTESEFKKI